MKSFKIKIYFVCALWVILVFVMFAYLFNIFDNSNMAVVTDFAKQQHDLALLRAQQESFKQANSDLKKVESQKYKPEDLFSKDVTFVNELRILESLGEQTGVQLQITGISGTVKSVPKAPTLSPLYQIAYGFSITGSLDNCLAFLQHLEHLPFSTTVSSLSVSPGSDNVSMSLSGLFYIKPQ